MGVRHHTGLNGSKGRADEPTAVARLAKGGSAYAVVGDGREKKALPEEAALNGRVYPDQSNWWQPFSEKPTEVTVGLVQKGPPAGMIATGAATHPARAYRLPPSHASDHQKAVFARACSACPGPARRLR